MKTIAILGSGGGTTAKAILEAVQSGQVSYRVALVATTTPGARILEVGREHQIPAQQCTAETLQTDLLQRLIEEKVDLLVLAGFLKLLPATIIVGMNGNVVNTHPALLPDFGGKGMYGKHVHEAVARAGIDVSGVTLHWVDAEYDRGDIIEQVTVSLPKHATPSEIEDIVRQAERAWLPGALDRLLHS